MAPLDDFGIERDKEWESDSEKPWNEDQWEKFLEENERLVDKYQKVMEENPTLYAKHPLDLYFKVHHDLDPIDVFEDTDEEEGETGSPISEEDKRIWEQEEAEDRKQLNSILCYQSARKLEEFIRQFVEQFDLDHEKEDLKNLLIQLHVHAFKVHANILSGHCHGYDDDVLCANIVKCKWAVKNINSTIEILEKLEEKLPPHREDLATLRTKAKEVKEDILLWIENLRSKVWWA